jgi:hypothetical protein
MATNVWRAPACPLWFTFWRAVARPDFSQRMRYFLTNDAYQLAGRAAPWSPHACSGERPSRLRRDEASSSHPRWEDGSCGRVLYAAQPHPLGQVFGTVQKVMKLSPNFVMRPLTNGIPLPAVMVPKIPLSVFISPIWWRSPKADAATSS